MESKDIPLNLLAKMIPTRSALYHIMVKNSHYFLPPEKSPIITEDYLLGVLNGEYFSMKLEERKELLFKQDLKATKSELINEISKFAKKPLGFTVKSSPDKNWLFDVLNTLDSNNRLIVGDPETTFTRKVPEQFLENLPVNLRGAKRKGQRQMFFKLRKEERMRQDLAKKKRIFKIKEERVSSLTETLEAAKKALKDCQQEIQDLEMEIECQNNKKVHQTQETPI